jgi:hypothetical protein
VAISLGLAQHFRDDSMDLIRKSRGGRTQDIGGEAGIDNSLPHFDLSDGNTNGHLEQRDPDGCRLGIEFVETNGCIAEKLLSGVHALTSVNLACAVTVTHLGMMPPKKGTS